MADPATVDPNFLALERLIEQQFAKSGAASPSGWATQPAIAMPQAPQAPNLAGHDPQGGGGQQGGVSVSPLNTPPPVQGDQTAALIRALAQQQQTPAAAAAGQTVAPQLKRPVIGQGPAPAGGASGQGGPADPAHPPVIGHPQTQPQPANANAAGGLSPDMNALVQGLPPELRAAFLWKFANDQRLEQQLVDKQNQQSKLVDAMLKEVPPAYGGTDSALRAPPPVPDIQPIKAFQNWGVALAMLGSLATRRPLTAALKTGGAAMKAYNEGRWQDYAAQRQNWKDSVDLAMKQNELEYRRYEAARERYKDDLDKQTLAYQQIATEFNDQVAMHDIQNGEMDSFLQMRKQLLDEQYKYAALNYRYRLGYGGMTAAQRVHDQRIQDARDELKAQGVDWNDPGFLASDKMKSPGGFQTPEQKRLYTLYNTARQPLYGSLYALPGGGDESGGQGGVGQPVPITPDMPVEIRNAPDGKRVRGPDNKVWIKHGDSLVPTGQPVPATLAATGTGG